MDKTLKPQTHVTVDSPPSGRGLMNVCKEVKRRCAFRGQVKLNVYKL
jgi:hypothetical protein